MARPVVGHQNPGQSWMAVEDDAEHVVGLALVPVGCRVSRYDGWDVWVAVGNGDFKSNPPVMSHRLHVIDRVQLATLVGRIVHPGNAAAELKAQVSVVSEVADQLWQMLPRDMEGDLAAMDDHLGDHIAEVGNQRADAFIHLIPPATERRRGGSWELDRPSQAAIAGGVAGALDPEHALPDLKDLGGGLGSGKLRFVLLSGSCLRADLRRFSGERLGLGFGVRFGLALRNRPLDGSLLVRFFVQIL